MSQIPPEGTKLFVLSRLHIIQCLDKANFPPSTLCYPSSSQMTFTSNILRLKIQRCWTYLNGNLFLRLDTMKSCEDIAGLHICDPPSQNELSTVIATSGGKKFQRIQYPCSSTFTFFIWKNHTHKCNYHTKEKKIKESCSQVKLSKNQVWMISNDA